MRSDMNTHIKEILKKFFRGLLIYLCAGFILSIGYKFCLNANGKEAVMTIINENSAPTTFYLIANYSTFALSVFVLIGGLTEGNPSLIEKVLAYYPAEFALNFAVVFIGLMLGY